MKEQLETNPAAHSAVRPKVKKNYAAPGIISVEKLEIVANVCAGFPGSKTPFTCPIGPQNS